MFTPYISFSIWIEARAKVRLARGLERDGLEMLEQWRSWMAEEDRYIADEAPHLRADLVVSGESERVGAPGAWRTWRDK